MPKDDMLTTEITIDDAANRLLMATAISQTIIMAQPTRLARDRVRHANIHLEHNMLKWDIPVEEIVARSYELADALIEAAKPKAKR